MLPTTTRGYERLQKALYILKLKQWVLGLYMGLWVVTLGIAISLAIYTSILL